MTANHTASATSGRQWYPWQAEFAYTPRGKTKTPPPSASSPTFQKPLKAAHFPHPWAESRGKDAPGRAGGADPHSPHTAACFIPKQGVLSQSWDTCQVDMMLRTTEAEWRTAPTAVAELLSEKQLPLDSISLQGSLAVPGRPPQ